MKDNDLTVSPWQDYELLDSGSNYKLERFGDYVLIRPETQAVWNPQKPELWERADAEFRSANGKGFWKKWNIPDEWELSWHDMHFTARLTSFKHTGIFPEQALNWEWIAEQVSKLEEPKVLNLFGYTGLASIAAAQAGAKVTHADASKQSNMWAKSNAGMSNIGEGGIRYMLDDCIKFVEREKRRGSIYEGIILDPPSFGRGPKGEVWKIEERLTGLIASLKDLLSDKPGSFFLINGYAAGYSPTSFKQATEDVFGLELQGEYGELKIEESGTGRCVPSGIYARFVR
jgi:23S rRNA (cytosine1962-C5)-methyltransferase